MHIYLNFTCKYTFSFDQDFVFIEKYNFLVNLKTNRILKQVTKGGSIGYVLKGNFYSLTFLKSKLLKIKNEKTPF